MSDPEAPSDEPQAVDLEEFVVILPEEMEGGDYCLQNGPRLAMVCHPVYERTIMMILA